jgi:transcriptional regulator with GAF, ATPase, and Fis domain
MAAVSAAFGSLGRVCLGLDANFRIRHVSDRLDDLLGPGAARRYFGVPVDELVGPELFGPAGPLRQALLAGERREGWRASLRVEPSGSRLVSLSVAPMQHDEGGACDPEALYIVVLRPAEDDAGTRDAAPTSFSGLVARSQQMVRVLRLVLDLESSEATVLITGESGTGKGLLAHAIHTHSPRRGGRLVEVNCAALPENLLESELFGHVRGAFTGALRDRMGRFELANGGTLFLDEIGDVPLHLQAKLLRVLQNRSFERVGESRTVTTDVRVITATHRDLRRAVEQGRFREDLYYRLRVFPIEIPPLRTRREDIEPIARYLLGRVGARNGRAVQFSPDALRALLSYAWPGNVRELENALEYAVAVARGQTVQPEDLPPEVIADPSRAAACPEIPPSAPAGTTPAPEIRAEPPSRGRPARQLIQQQLALHHWRINETSQALGVCRTTLWRWMREFGLSR